MKNKSIKIILKSALLLALAAAFVLGAGCSGCSCGPAHGDEPLPTEAADTDVPATDEPTAVPTEKSRESAAPVKRDLMGYVYAVPTGTYGVASDGSIRFMGEAVSGQNLIFDWIKVNKLASNGSVTAALMRDGSISFAAITEDGNAPFTGTADWTGVTDIAMGRAHIVGLVSGGSVTALGEDNAGQCAVAEWTGIAKIVAAADYTLGLNEECYVVAAGLELSEEVNEEPVIDIAAAEDHFSVLYYDGTVKAYPVSGGESKSFDWSDIAFITAAEGATYGVDSTGRLFTDADFIEGETTGVYSVSASKTHAVVLHGDGTCEGFGDDSHLAVNVTGWRLLPYVSEEGWLLGLTPGAELDGAPVATGREISWADPVTCEAKDAVCVLIGDVNGDGAIDDTDVKLVKDHAAKKTQLKGAFLRAADAVADTSRPGSIDVNDIDVITAQAEGTGAADQYAKTYPYMNELADARRLNPDALGYITLEGTNISYPIMYGQNWYYNDHNINKASTGRGSIYFYWSRPNRNIVITGHNSRQSGTMFHELHHIQDSASKLGEYKNRVWCINTYGQTGYWEVWAMYEEGAFRRAEDSSQYFNTCWPYTFNAMNEQDRQGWLEYQLGKNTLDFDASVCTNDRFMTLVTCGDNHYDAKLGARLYFFLRWVGND